MSVTIHTTKRKAARRQEELLAQYDFMSPAVRDFLTKHRNVAVQLPDSLLSDSFAVVELLSAAATPPPTIRVMADTTFARCCVDEATAEHIPGCDGIVHIGPSCSSSTSRLPVLHLPGVCGEEWVAAIVSEVRALAAESAPVAVAFSNSVRVHHDRLLEELRSIGDDRQVLLEGEMNVGLGTVPTKAKSFYLVTVEGLDDGHVRPLALVAAAQGASCHVTKCGAVDLKLYTQRVRQRPFFDMKVEEAQSVGIMVCSLSIDGTNAVTRYLYEATLAAGKRPYVLFVGKVNVAKLSNFAMDVDVFTLIGCPNNSVLLMAEAKEFPRPILTPLEMWAALRKDCEEDQELVREIGAGIASTSIEFTTRILARSALLHAAAANGEEGSGADVPTSTALSIAQPLAMSTVARVQARTYQGLDPDVGRTVVQAELIQGRAGVAKGYSHEHNDDAKQQ
eukprot:PhM_4_TR3579/c0_g1_i1/m.50757/K17866/DPH2; diphthamide biosynthesis protein 2